MSSTDTTVKTLHHFIDGSYTAGQSSDTFDNINPATGEVLVKVPRGQTEDVDKAVKAAREAFDNGPWPKMTIKERCEILKKVGDGILKHKKELALLETQDTGKPISESLEGDIPRSAHNFHFFAEYAPSLNDQCFVVNDMEHHLGLREPLGVAALITPWNLPLYLATWKIAPCLAMGNTCVVKPAEWTPQTLTKLGEICNEAGLPPGVFNMVHGFGPGEAGEALTRHEGVDCISFTGETTTGIAIMKAAADSLKKVSFELGGKGANIIFDDADLDLAIPTSVRAAFRNQGEICLTGSRLYVHRSVYETVVKKLTETIQEIRLGDPNKPDTTMGAIISQEQLEKIESYIAIGKEEGSLLSGGERDTSIHPNGLFLQPTVFRDISNTSRICQEEIFGPVLPVIPFETEAEVIDMANSTKYGLSASIWSQDVNRCHRVSKALRIGIVWVNCWFARDLRTPFGGMKKSGIGREGGRYALDFFSEPKAVCYRYSPQEAH